MNRRTIVTTLRVLAVGALGLAVAFGAEYVLAEDRSDPPATTTTTTATTTPSTTDVVSTTTTTAPPATAFCEALRNAALGDELGEAYRKAWTRLVEDAEESGGGQGDTDPYRSFAQEVAKACQLQGQAPPASGAAADGRDAEVTPPDGDDQTGGGDGSTGKEPTDTSPPDQQPGDGEGDGEP